MRPCPTVQVYTNAAIGAALFGMLIVMVVGGAMQAAFTSYWSDRFSSPS